MLKILIKFMISSDGESPGQLVERLRGLGGMPLAGDYDIEIPLGDNERLFAKMDGIHSALRGSGVFYTLHTCSDEREEKEEQSMPSIMTKAGGEEKLTEIRKNAYKSKLARWREMGVDTSQLEQLLETDLEKFKEMSKTFLREHLDKHKVIEDVDRRDLKRIDESVHTRVSAGNASIEDVCKTCKLIEKDAVFSLGRLMSAGKVVKVMKDGKETYSLAPPTEPEKAEKAEEELPQPLLTGPAEDRVYAVIRPKGSSVKQICQDSKLPELQALNAISALIDRGMIKAGKRGKSPIYLKSEKEPAS